MMITSNDASLLDIERDGPRKYGMSLKRARVSGQKSNPRSRLRKVERPVLTQILGKHKSEDTAVTSTIHEQRGPDHEVRACARLPVALPRDVLGRVVGPPVRERQLHVTEVSALLQVKVGVAAGFRLVADV